jgi:(1->4)-alpha-D-glucan 1-alpha-D-glucosylmutase
MLSTMTHDTKRSGDVRARIAALASMPEEWETAVRRWFEISQPLRTAGAPDDLERYFLFQTLVGAWPIGVERIVEYMGKALREAKRNTNWIEPNLDWEHAVERFCRQLYVSRDALRELEPFVTRVATAGERVALGQLVLKLTTPGIPDTYQGDELFNRALVDPDNRRPVDWSWRGAMLRRLMGGSRPNRETSKLFVTLRLLGLRARRPDPFNGTYTPLEGGRSTCAFLRGDDLLVVVGTRDRLEGTLELPRGRWRDVLRGEERSFSGGGRVGDLLGRRSVGVFERIASA